jgi:hypothetical protein
MQERYFVWAFVAFVVSGCATDKPATLDHDGGVSGAVSRAVEARYAVPPACQRSSVETTRSHLKFSGVELPIGHVTQPVKIGSFEWGPDVINQASDRVQVMDQHRLYVCANLGYMTDPAKRDAAAQKAIEDEGVNYRLALALSSGDPTKVKEALSEQSKKADEMSQDSALASAKPALAKQAEAVKLAPGTVDPPHFNNSELSTPQVQSAAPGDHTYRLTADMAAGDCTLYSGSSVAVSGTTAAFTLISSTRQSMSGDIWHQFWQGRDQQGNVVMTIGPANSDGRMWPHQPVQKTTTTGTVPVNGAANIDQVVDVVWQGQC